jgi:hypothetical protein
MIMIHTRQRAAEAAPETSHRRRDLKDGRDEYPKKLAALSRRTVMVSCNAVDGLREGSSLSYIAKRSGLRVNTSTS